MKKLTRSAAFVLAAIMLISCFGAFAAYSSGLYPYYDYPYYPNYPYYYNNTNYYNWLYPYGFGFGGVYNGETLGSVRITRANSQRRQVSVNDHVYKIRVVALTNSDVSRNSYIQPDAAGKAMLFTESLMRGDNGETMLMLNCALSSTDNIALLADTKSLKALCAEGVDLLGLYDADSFAFSLDELVSAAESASTDEVLVTLRKNAKGEADAQAAVSAKNDTASDIYIADVSSNAVSGRSSIGASVSVYPKFSIDQSESVLVYSFDGELAKHKTRVVSNPISGTNYASPVEPVACGEFVGVLIK